MGGCGDRLRVTAHLRHFLSPQPPISGTKAHKTAAADNGGRLSPLDGWRPEWQGPTPGHAQIATPPASDGDAVLAQHGVELGAVVALPFGQATDEE